MSYRLLALPLMLVALAGLVSGAVFLSGTGVKCTFMKPGETKVFVLTIEQPETGTYIVTATSDGLTVTPQELTLHLEANESATRWIRVSAPVNVYDEYYTLDISIYDAETGDFIESEQYCFHVYKGVLASAAPDVVFGYKDVELREGKVLVTLYVTNLGRTTATAMLDADYGNVTFERNPVVVKGYRTVEVKAEIPADEYLPEFVTFYAYVGDSEKKVTVRMPVTETSQPRIKLEIPARMTIDSPLETFAARITNDGEMPVTVTLSGKALPFGVGLYSDEVELEPGEAAIVTAYLTVDRVIRTGTFLSKVCVEDRYGAELVCKHIVLELTSEKKVEAQETATPTSYTVTITVENGAEEYSDVSVEVETPQGWSYEVSPTTVDLEPYEVESITVTFTPAEDAVDGTAVVKLVTPDGTVIAQKTVALSKSALTGYATVGAGSPLALIIAAIVIALIVALVIKKGKRAVEEEEEFEELTRKE